MTQCCNNEIYLSDKFCPDCGKAVTAISAAKDAFELDPSITQSYASIGKPFTGRVVGAQYYTRHAGDHAYGYVWVTIKTKDGKIEQVNVTGETENFQNIKVGDVVSIHSPDGLNLTHAVNKSQRATITNNRFPHIAVLHGEDNTNYAFTDTSISSPSEAHPTAGNCIITAGISLFVAWMMFSSWDFSPTSPWFIGVCALPVICLWLAIKSTKTNRFRRNRAASAATANDKLMNIFYKELGFSHHQRPEPTNGIICQGCDGVVSSTTQYCHHCGTGTQLVSEPSIQPIATSENKEQTHAVNKQTTVENTSFTTVNQRNQALAKDYELKDSKQYRHRYCFSKNTENKAHYVAKLVKVTGKNMGANAESGVQVTEHVTEYKNNFGVVVDTETRTTSKSYRSLYLKGHLQVKDKDGNEFAFNGSAQVLSDTNIGDVLLIAESQLDSKRGCKYFLEYVYNLTNDKKHDYEGNGLGYYSIGTTGSSILNMLILVALVITLCVIAPVVGIVAIILSISYACATSLIFTIGNHDRKKGTIRALRENLKKCIQNRDSIIKGFK